MMIQYSVHTSAADLDLTYTISTSEGIGRYLAKSRLFYVMVDLRECSNEKRRNNNNLIRICPWLLLQQVGCVALFFVNDHAQYQTTRFKSGWDRST